MKQITSFALVAWLASSAQGLTIPTVSVGNQGNPTDVRYIDNQHLQGVGTVAYPFNIGKTEITNAQYVEFLNAVAGSDPYHLFQTGGFADPPWRGIGRTGSSPNYRYYVRPPELNGTYSYENKPVVYVNVDDAMRFANWLHNGQPVGTEDATTTEDGAYTLNGATTVAAILAVHRNAGARWWLPNEDEWYKAAYYDARTGTYFDYPTQSNQKPDNSPPELDTGNSANYQVFLGNFTTGSTGYTYTDAGAYTHSVSPYGTLDQGGNVTEFLETVVLGNERVSRGGSWHHFSEALRASGWEGANYLDLSGDKHHGFRLATDYIPEPPSASIYGQFLAAALFIHWRRLRWSKTV